MSISYGTPLPCKCGSKDLFAWHQYGAKVVCKSCGAEGPFVHGSRYQDEERAAVVAWNKLVGLSKSEVK